jgi:predicted nucleic acid-binding protein
VIVIDSSTIIQLLVGRVDIRRLMDETLVAPHLIDAEIGHGLRRMVLITKELSVGDAVQAIEEYTAFDLRRYGHLELMGRALQLRDNLSFYDALYVSLAEMLDVPLVTLDARIAGAPGVEAIVEVLPMGA